LQGNSYSKNFFKQFCAILKEAKNLETLNFNDIFVSRGKEEIPESLDIFAGSLIGKNIISLDLSNNAVNPFGAKAISTFLKQSASLRTFLISNCGLGIDGVTVISQSLKESGKNLEVWSIARNRAENEGAKQIALAITAMPNLREL